MLANNISTESRHFSNCPGHEKEIYNSVPTVAVNFPTTQLARSNKENDGDSVLRQLPTDTNDGGAIPRPYGGGAIHRPYDGGLIPRPYDGGAIPRPFVFNPPISDANKENDGNSILRQLPTYTHDGGTIPRPFVNDREESNPQSFINSKDGEGVPRRPNYSM